MVRIIGLITVMLVFTGCTKDFEGTYEDPNKREIVDDKWNETDNRETAQKIVSTILSKPWLEAYRRANNGQRPVVVVDEIENRTDEHIDTKMLTEFIRDELINSGRVRFLNKARRQAIIDEVKYQNSGQVSQSSAKKSGRQTGADFFLGGAIASSVHSRGGLKTVTYQTNVVLTNLETSEISYSGKEVRKKKLKLGDASW